MTTNFPGGNAPVVRAIGAMLNAAGTNLGGRNLVVSAIHNQGTHSAIHCCPNDDQGIQVIVLFSDKDKRKMNSVAFSIVCLGGESPHGTVFVDLVKICAAI